MSNGRSFLADYLKQREEQFANWCYDNGLKYDANPDSESRITNFEAWERELKERVERRKEEEKRQAELDKAIEISTMVKEFERTIPIRYRNADLSQIKPNPLVTALRNGSSGVILGSNGAGKNHLAWAMIRDWVKNGDTYVFIKAQELLYDIKTKDNPYRYMRERFDRIRHLLIDEIDKIFESKADFIYLNYLVDHRYEWEMQTIVIGNGDTQTFISALGQSIFSRLCGEGGVSMDIDASDKRFT